MMKKVYSSFKKFVASDWFAPVVVSALVGTMEWRAETRVSKKVHDDTWDSMMDAIVNDSLEYGGAMVEDKSGEFWFVTAKKINE